MTFLSSLFGRMSGCCNPGPKADQHFADIFRLWEGSEEVVEWGFRLHDYEQIGEVPYEELEPMLRHVLWKIGEVWMIQKFHQKDSSAMDVEVIKPYIEKFGVDLTRPLNLANWKILCGSWFELCLDTRAEQAERQREHATSMQKLQVEKYCTALEHFAETYALAIRKRNEEIAEEHKKEAHRSLQFSDPSISEAFRNHQLQVVELANAEAQRQLEEARQTEKVSEECFMNKLPFQARPFGAVFGQPFNEEVQAPQMLMPGVFKRRETSAIVKKREDARTAQEQEEEERRIIQEAQLAHERAVQHAASRGFTHLAVRVN